MVHGELGPGTTGQHASDFRLQVLPRHGAPEIVHEEYTSILEIVPQRGHFAVTQCQALDVLHVDEGMLSEIGTGELENAGVRIDFHRRELLEAMGEIEIGVGEIDDPSHSAETATTA